MKSILAAQRRHVLDRFAWSSVLLAFDFDGTLAPIVADPDAAQMRPRTRALLAALARVYPCVVISGRAVVDVAGRLAGVPVRQVVGNHGVEPWQGTRAVSREVARWRARLERRLGGLPGVTIEDKVYSIAIHYRRSREKRAAREAIYAAVAELDRARVVGGKLVVNAIPADAPHKGNALLRARARFRCDTAIYVGDDETDEDVFDLDEPGRLLTIRVGARRGSRADYCIRGQREIDRLLLALLEQRPSTERPLEA